MPSAGLGAQGQAHTRQMPGRGKAQAGGRRLFSRGDGSAGGGRGHFWDRGVFGRCYGGGDGGGGGGGHGGAAQLGWPAEAPPRQPGSGVGGIVAQHTCVGDGWVSCGCTSCHPVIIDSLKVCAVEEARC